MTAGELQGGTGGVLGGGFHVVAADIRRSLGLNPDVSTVQIVMSSAGFPQPALPEPGREWALVGTDNNVTAATINQTASVDDPSAPLLPPLRPLSLVPMDDFKMLEAAEGEHWETKVPRLLVDQVVLENPINADPDLPGGTAYVESLDGIKVLTITLRDQRALWESHGRFLPQVEFNRRQPDGSIRENTKLRILGTGSASTFPRDGRGVLKTPTFADLVRFVCRHLPNKDGTGVSVTRVPPRWENADVIEINDWPVALEPYDAIRRLLDMRPARLALNSDNSVSFWLAGEGKVGYNVNNKSSSNDTKLPEAQLWEDQVEYGLGWVPGYLTAVGQHTIATVKMPAVPVVFPNRRLTANEIDPDLNLPGASPDDDPGLGGSPEYLYDWWGSVLRQNDIRNRQDAIDLTQRSVDEALRTGDTTTAIAAQASLIGQTAALEELQNSPVKMTVRDYLYLHRLVLRPDVFLSPNAKIDRRTLAIIRRDAFKKWMIDGTVAIQGVEDGSRNLHLLPVENRAEVDFEGRRRAPKAQTYRFARVRTPIGGRPGALSTNINVVEPKAAREALDAHHDVWKLIHAIDESLGDRNILLATLDRLNLDLRLTGRVQTFGNSDLVKSASRQKVGEGLKERENRFWAGKKGLIDKVRQSPGRFRSVTEAGFTPIQFVNRLAAEGLFYLMPKLKAQEAGYTTLANAYDQRLQVYLRSQPKVATTPFTADLGVQIAEKMIEAGDLIKEGKLKRSAAASSIPISNALVLVGRAAERLKELNRRKDDGEPLADVQRGPRSQAYNMATHLENMPLLDDDSLRLIDRDRGVWESRDPVVQVDATNVPNEQGRTAVPRVVYLLFGTRMKPALDSKKPANARVVTGNRIVNRLASIRQGDGEGNGQTMWQYADSVLALKMHPGATKPSGDRPLHHLLDDPKPVIPPQVQALRKDETLGFYAQAFQRPGLPEKPGDKAPPPEAKNLSDIPADQGAPVAVTDLQELITLKGVTNRLSLFTPAQTAVSAKFAELEPTVKGRESVYLRPWNVALNGVVSGVQWGMQPDGAGWTTTVIQGLPDRPFRFQNKTRARKAKRPEANKARYAEDRSPN